MEDRYMISIIGEQRLDGQSDKIEVITSGDFVKKGNRFLIRYKEYDRDNPNDCFNNLVKVEGSFVTVTRNGSMKSQLLLEKGRRHQCVYSTLAGNIMIGVFTKEINAALNEDGGTLEVIYTLDFNSDFVSENSFFIKVEKKK